MTPNPMNTKYRQEVLNVLLAQLLQERGVITAPESIITLGKVGAHRMPDVIVHFHGLRTVIEGEVAYRKKAREIALGSARRRVEEGIAHIGVAVIYPAGIRKVDFSEVKAALSKCELQIAIITESGSSGFVPGNVDYLEGSLRHAFEQLVQENVVMQAVATLDAGIERFADMVAAKAGDMGRLAECLGIRDLTEEKSETSEDPD